MGNQLIDVSSVGRARAAEALVSTHKDPPMEIRQALALLDPDNDEHWIAGGSPAVAAVADVLGLPANGLTRAAIEEAYPGFNRANSWEGKGKQTAPVRLPEDGQDGQDTAEDDPRDRVIRDLTRRLDRLEHPDAVRSAARCYLYHVNCREGEIFEGPAIDTALDDGWEDSPAKLEGYVAPE